MGQWDFTLRVEFSFLCFFVERDKEVVILLRELRKPGKVAAPHPSQAHYPLVRYTKARRMEASGQTSKKTFRPPLGLMLGTRNELVAFEQEVLEIRPRGKEQKKQSLNKSIHEVYDTSKLILAAKNLPPNSFKVAPNLATDPLSSNSMQGLLAGRIALSQGELFIDRASGSMTANKFSLFPLDANFEDRNQAHDQQGFQIARTVTWELAIEAEKQEEAFVDFVFHQKDSSSSLRLYADPTTRRVDVFIRNCEESEIERVTPPSQYEDNIHKGEMMACYPLLQGFIADPVSMPLIKLAPFSLNGSGICAPLKSS